MSEEIAISLQDISKCFKRYTHPVNRLKELLLPQKTFAQEFWALRDINLEVSKGETVGIVGQNGSGKSTLLQIIAGTLSPTTGEVNVKGRVSALLELGSGFNPEFTGRQNISFNGRLLGLTQKEIEDKFDQIVAFADIGEFIEQPVKTYSSGMFVRLAFAVVANVEPEVLIVDEALAVGDMFFQAKCMARMRQMMDAGVTVLFVSHDIGSVKSLCRQCVFLENGEIKNNGEASRVVEIYLSAIREKANKELETEFSQSIQPLNTVEQLSYKSSYKSIDKKEDNSGFDIVVETKEPAKLADGAYRYGDGRAKILDIKILDSSHQVTNQIEYKQDFFIQASIQFETSLSTFCTGYLIKDLKGIELIGTTTITENIDMPAVEAGEIYVIEAKTKNILNEGIYTVVFGVEIPVMPNEQHIYLDVIDNSVVFKINAPKNPKHKFWSRTYAPVEIEFSKVSN